MTENGTTRIIQDLRTPLTSVRSLSEILHDNPHINGKKRLEFLDIIIHEIEKMTGIIQTLESPVQSPSNSVVQT